MYGTIIIRNTIERSIELLAAYRPQLHESGNAFVLVRNEVDSHGDISHDFMDVIAAATGMGYVYVNTIVVPTAIQTASELPDNVLYVVWLANSRNHFFNKDAIRERHIWKDVEWGRRTKNYNAKGKDPGNVWIPTLDDGHAHITHHLLLSLGDIVSRLRRSTEQEGLETLVTGCDEESAPPASQRPVCPEPPSATPSKVTARVIWGTSEDMSEVADGSISTIVTSPPYWDLKDYFKPGQIGQESYDTYLARLETVWQQCHAKLTPQGSLWVNINIRTKNGRAILIPHDIATQCRRLGFHYKGVLIWHKSSGIPTHDRNLVDHHEYVLVFSKAEQLNVNSLLTTFSDYKNSLINGGLIWNINRKAGSVGKHYQHPAIFPTELVSRIIRITTNASDTILDPFLGSGTTLIAAAQTGRNSIGYEYNEGFRELIMSRMERESSPSSLTL